MPAKSDVVLRAKWIAAIAKHQKYDESRFNFNVCIRHFQATDIVLRGKDKCLKLNAAPTIFNEPTSSCKVDDNINSKSNANSSQIECEKKCHLLQAKVAELEKQLFNMKVQHDVEIQKLKMNSENLRHTQSDRLKQTKKQLSKQKSKVLRMEDLIKELHEKKYISPDDAKFLNVRVCSKYLDNFVIFVCFN